MTSSEEYIGWSVYSQQRERIGKIVRVHYHEVTGYVEWVTVRIGGFFTGGGYTIIPLHVAQIREDHIVVPYSRVHVQSAPVHGINDPFTDVHKQRFASHYELPPEVTAAPITEPIETSEPIPDQPPDRPTEPISEPPVVEPLPPETVVTPPPEPTVPPAVVPVAEEEVIRSEEELEVGTETVETARVRIKKNIVTEHEVIEVPVSHEEVIIEREPIVGTPSATPLHAEEHEMTLHQERPVVSKHTVEKERIKVHKELVDETAVVEQDVSREEIEIEESAPLSEPPRPTQFRAEATVTEPTDPTAPSGVEPTLPGAEQPVDPPVTTTEPEPVAPPIEPLPPITEDDDDPDRPKREHPAHPAHPHGGPPGQTKRATTADTSQTVQGRGKKPKR